MSEIVGIGIDLTQHVPLVSVALCPEAVRADDAVDTVSLALHWPPRVETRELRDLREPLELFREQPPVCVLPLMAGEPLLVANAAAKHRRSAGLSWPPEAKVPYAGDSACGLGRIPLVAAWMALLPPPGDEETMARRDDVKFKWWPDGREHAVRAGRILATSVRAFLNAARLLPNSCLTAIVVPDGLDEAGQQILLDNLGEIGLPIDFVHLLPRPLAVALHWCNTAQSLVARQAVEDAEGTAIGRLRVATMSLDVWEAVSLELRARRNDGRVWLMPVRDRVRLAGALPELETLGISFALGLARANSNGEPLSWWHRLFASDWLTRRLAANQALAPHEIQAIREVRSTTPPEGLRRELDQLRLTSTCLVSFFSGWSAYPGCH